MGMRAPVSSETSDRWVRGMVSMRLTKASDDMDMTASASSLDTADEMRGSTSAGWKM
jgi:hypothetical protein